MTQNPNRSRALFVSFAVALATLTVPVTAANAAAAPNLTGSALYVDGTPAVGTTAALYKKAIGGDFQTWDRIKSVVVNEDGSYGFSVSKSGIFAVKLVVDEAQLAQFYYSTFVNGGGVSLRDYTTIAPQAEISFGGVNSLPKSAETKVQGGAALWLGSSVLEKGGVYTGHVACKGYAGGHISMTSTINGQHLSESFPIDAAGNYRTTPRTPGMSEVYIEADGCAGGLTDATSGKNKIATRTISLAAGEVVSESITKSAQKPVTKPSISGTVVKGRTVRLHEGKWNAGTKVDSYFVNPNCGCQVSKPTLKIKYTTAKAPKSLTAHVMTQQSGHFDGDFVVKKKFKQ